MASDGHRITLSVGRRKVETLADLPPSPGGLLFVGLDPSPTSVAAGHYHQDPLGQRFWMRLVQARILPAGTDLALADDALTAAGHGITDLVKLPTARDQVDDEALRAGVGPLWQRAAQWRPGAIVFIYKRAAEIVAGRPLPEPWGKLEGVALAARSCFLMPGPYAPAEEVAAGLKFIGNLSRAVSPRPRQSSDP